MQLFTFAFWLQSKQAIWKHGRPSSPLTWAQWKGSHARKERGQVHWTTLTQSWVSVVHHPSVCRWQSHLKTWISMQFATFTLTIPDSNYVSCIVCGTYSSLFLWSCVNIVNSSTIATHLSMEHLNSYHTAFYSAHTSYSIKFFHT